MVYVWCANEEVGVQMGKWISPVDIMKCIFCVFLRGEYTWYVKGGPQGTVNVGYPYEGKECQENSILDSQ
jgi:hypothetical protein